MGERAFVAFLRFLVLLEEDGRCERVILLNEGVRALFEGGAVLIRPPVRQVARPVVARALVVEAVPDLVADDRANSAEVHRVVGFGVEERRLKDRGWEDDLVLRGVVVGVDGLGGHVPLVAVHRAAKLCPFAVGGVSVSGAHVLDDRRLRVQVQRRVVAPLDGVADLGIEGRELVQRFHLGVLAHPVEASDRLAVGVEETAHQGVHRLLGVGREVAGHPRAAHGLAQVGLDKSEGALPARTKLLRAGQGTAVEVEVLVDEIARQERRMAVDRRGAQPFLEHGQVGVGPQGGGSRQEVGLVDVHDEAGDGHARGLRPRVPVEAWSQGGNLLPGGRVVGE